jgi:hypothetical protein
MEVKQCASSGAEKGNEQKGLGMFGFADIFSPWQSSSELDFAHLAYRKCCPPYLTGVDTNGNRD